MTPDGSASGCRSRWEGASSPGPAPPGRSGRQNGGLRGPRSCRPSSPAGPGRTRPSPDTVPDLRNPAGTGPKCPSAVREGWPSARWCISQFRPAKEKTHHHGDK